MYIAHTREILQEYGAKLDAASAVQNTLLPIANAMQHNTLYCLTRDGRHVEDLTRDYAAELNVQPGDVRAVAFKTLLHSVGTGMFRNEIERMMLSAAFDEFRILHPEEESQDPYFQNIVIPDAELDGFSLGHVSFKAGEFDMYDASKNENPYSMYGIPRIGVWNKDFQCPSASKDGSVWMTVTPSETNTMREHIRAAHGNVLVLGLGLGYFVYMAHRKPDVSSVTIVEIDPGAIGLFQQHILPQFDHPEKISIIQADAVAYTASLEDGLFDTLFADIWKDVLDTGPYLSIKSASRHLEKTAVSCWIEEGMMQTIKGTLSMVLMDSMGLPVPEYAKDKLYRYLYKLTARTRIQTPEDMRELFTTGYLQQLIKTRTSVTWHG